MRNVEWYSVTFNPDPLRGGQRYRLRQTMLSRAIKSEICSSDYSSLQGHVCIGVSLSCL